MTKGRRLRWIRQEPFLHLRYRQARLLRPHRNQCEHKISSTSRLLLSLLHPLPLRPSLPHQSRVASQHCKRVSLAQRRHYKNLPPLLPLHLDPLLLRNSTFRRSPVPYELGVSVEQVDSVIKISKRHSRKRRRILQKSSRKPCRKQLGQNRILQSLSRLRTSQPRSSELSPR